MTEGADYGAGIPDAARRMRVTTPGNWVGVDADALAWAAEHAPPGASPSLKRSFDYLKIAAQAMQFSPTIFSAILVVPPRTDAVATMASYLIGGCPGRGEALRELVASNPPNDAVEGTFSAEVVNGSNGTSVRAECLRRAVLQVPSNAGVSLSVEYFLPLEDTGDMVVTQFTTPQVQDADVYRPVFDSIAESIVLV